MSGTINPAIALQVGQGAAPPINPLAMAGQAAGLQNALTQNRAIEAGIKQTETGTQGMAQQQAMQRMDVATRLLGGILSAHPDGVPASAVASGMAEALTMGIVKREDIAKMLSPIPMGDDPQSTAQRTQMLRQQHMVGLGIQEQINRLRGVPTLVQTGGEQVPMLIGESVRPMGGVIPNTLSPGEQNSVQNVPEIVNGQPTGRMMPATGAQIAAGNGNAGILPGGRFPTTGRPPVAPGAVPGMPAPMPAPPGTQPAAPTAPAPPTGPRPVTLGPAIGPDQGTAMAGNAAEGVKQGSALTSAADLIPQQRAMLGEMESALDQFTTGKGQQAALNFKSYVQSFAPERLAQAFGINPQNISSAETFNKLAQQIAIQQGAALGMNTDAARASVFGGNPNMEISKLGNKQIIHILQGNADALAAKAQAWAESPFRTKGDYSAFSTAWNKSFDPRVFQWAHMDKAERDIMLSGAGRDKAELAAKLRAMYAPQ